MSMISNAGLNTSKSGGMNTSEENRSVYKFKTKEISFNCRQLSAMLSSGLTLVKALDILSKEQETEKMQETYYIFLLLLGNPSTS